MRVTSPVMGAASHARQGGGERGGGGGGGGGGGAEGTLMLKNHSGSTYAGWVCGTMPLTSQDQLGTGWYTDGTRLIGFGRSVGRRWRMVHVRIPASGIASGGTLTIDLSTTTETTPPAMGTLADVPSVGGVALTLQTTTDDGPLRIYRYQGKLNTWFTATVWIYYAHGHNHHEVEMLITRSNNSDPDLDFKSVPNLTLAVGTATVTWTGTVPGAGSITFGNDCAMGFCGSLRYGAAGADIASAAARVDHPVELWCVEHAGSWPPLDRAPLTTASFNPNTFRTANLATLKTNVGTWNYSGLGPFPNSGIAGLQESEGWSSCCEAFDLGDPNAGTIFVRKLAAIELGHRNINYRESDGNLYTIFNRPNAVQFFGDPWLADGADMLGKPRQKIDTDCPLATVPGGGTARWHGADGQHYIIMVLPESYILTGSLLLQELVISWSVNWLLSHHLYPWATNTRTVDQHEPRAYGWIGFAAGWIYSALDNRDQAELLAIAWRNKSDQTYAAATIAEISFGKPMVGIFSPNNTALTANRWMFNNSHLTPGNFDPAGLAIDRYPGSYIENVSPDQAVVLIWHHSIGAGGVYFAWALMGGAGALYLLRHMAANVVEHGWFLDGGTWRAANTIGVNLANDLTGNRFSDNTFNEWNVLAVSVFLLVEDSSHPLWARASAIHAQRLAALNGNAQVHQWILPID